MFIHSMFSSFHSLLPFFSFSTEACHLTTFWLPAFWHEIPTFYLLEYFLYLASPFSMQLSDFSVFALQQFDYNEFILPIVYGGFWIGGFIEFISFGRIFDFFKYFPCSFSFVFFPWNSPNISVGQLGGVPPGSLGFV